MPNNFFIYLAIIQKTVYSKPKYIENKDPVTGVPFVLPVCKILSLSSQGV